MADLKFSTKLVVFPVVDRVRISLSDEILPFVIPKGRALVTSAFSSDLFRFLNPPAGYIAVDGTSLTVCEATDNDDGHCSVCAIAFVLLGPRVQVNRREKWFNLMLIAHTQKCIVIPKKKAADRRKKALPDGPFLAICL